MSNGWLSHLHQGTSVLFNFFWISKWNRTDSQWGTDAQKELATHDISPSAAHEGRRRRSWLFGSSLAAMGMMNQEASWAGPLLWAPWTPLLCTALSQAALSHPAILLRAAEIGLGKTRIWLLSSREEIETWWSDGQKRNGICNYKLSHKVSGELSPKASEFDKG